MSPLTYFLAPSLEACKGVYRCQHKIQKEWLKKKSICPHCAQVKIFSPPAKGILTKIPLNRTRCWQLDIINISFAVGEWKTDESTSCKLLSVIKQPLCCLCVTRNCGTSWEHLQKMNSFSKDWQTGNFSKTHKKKKLCTLEQKVGIVSWAYFTTEGERAQFYIQRVHL